MTDGGHRGDRVVEQVDHCALQRFAIDRDERNRGVERERELDVRMRRAEIRDGLAGERVEVTGDRVQMRHPRERRELIDQPLQILDFADDGSRAFLDQRRFDSRTRAELAPKPFS